MDVSTSRPASYRTVGRYAPSARSRSLERLPKRGFVDAKWLLGRCNNRKLGLIIKSLITVLRVAALLAVLASTAPILGADTLTKRLEKLDRNRDGNLSCEEAPKSFRKFKFLSLIHI